MFLLTFSSAVKYVLSLLLAVLGIISFEEINTTAGDPQESGQTVEVAREEPLPAMGSRNFIPDLLNPAAVEEIQPLTTIPARNEFGDRLSGDHSVSFTQVEFDLPLPSVLEVNSKLKTVRRYILVSSGDAKLPLREQVLMISTGI